MDAAASTSPRSTSLSALSTTLATKGAAAMERGTMEAVVPIVVPTTSLESGKRTIIRMMNGKDRQMFTIPSRIL